MSRPDRSNSSRSSAAAVEDDDALDHQVTTAAAAAVTRGESEEETARRMLNLLRAGADVRARKVRRLRAAVRVKAYENQLKLSIAVDRMVSRTLEDPQESAA